MSRGEVSRDDDRASRADNRSLAKICTGSRGWCAAQVITFDGQAVDADFTPVFGRCANGANPPGRSWRPRRRQ